MSLHDMQPLRRRVPDRPLRVRFKDDVSLHIGSADDLAMVPLTLPHRASLTWPEKSWKLNRRRDLEVAPHGQGADLHHGRPDDDLHCFAQLPVELDIVYNEPEMPD